MPIKYFSNVQYPRYQNQKYSTVYLKLSQIYFQKFTFIWHWIAHFCTLNIVCKLQNIVYSEFCLCCSILLHGWCGVDGELCADISTGERAFDRPVTISCKLVFSQLRSQRRDQYDTVLEIHDRENIWIYDCTPLLSTRWLHVNNPEQQQSVINWSSTICWTVLEDGRNHLESDFLLEAMKKAEIIHFWQTGAVLLGHSSEGKMWYFMLSIVLWSSQLQSADTTCQWNKIHREMKCDLR